MAKKKEQKQTINPQDYDSYILVAADLSLRRPGFCVLYFNRNNENPISKVQLYSVDNKTKQKSRGQLLLDNANIFKKILSLNIGHTPLFFVREKSINNCNVKMARSGSAAKSGVSEVVGVMDLIAWEIAHAEWDEIYPVTVKKTVTGSGKSEKTAVAKCLPLYYGKENPLEFRCDDESDAAAVAIAWLISKGEIKQIIQEDAIHEGQEKNNSCM